MTTTEDQKKVDQRPFTRDEYLESLRDGREIWIYGERVKDVTTHPAFRNTARSVARLYDALHDPTKRDVLSVETDTGNGGFTHPFFKVPYAKDDLRVARDAIAIWQRLAYGWLGRSPDYKASLLGTLGANSEFYEPYQENALRLVQEGAGEGPIPQPRDHPSTDRPRSPDRRGVGSLRPRGEGDGQRANR